MDSSMDYINRIKQEGFSDIKLEDSFTDGEFTQIKFQAGFQSYIACFRNNELLMIIWLYSDKPLR